MRIGFVGGSYTSRSNAVADEECINFFAETTETQGVEVSQKAYGGESGTTIKSLFGTPGVSIFCTFAGASVRAVESFGGIVYAVAGDQFCSVDSAGVITALGTVSNDGLQASLAYNSIQVLIVSGGKAYCWTIATAILLDVTAQLAAVPVKVEEADTYFIVCFQNSNKFQLSQFLDGTTWPGQLVNEVSVYPDNIVSIIVNHRELWVFGVNRTQPYQDTGSTEVYDVIPGALIEKGCISPFSPCRMDNSIFWVDQDERGGRSCWRSSGYTPTRVSVHAVETDLASYSVAAISNLVSYSYMDQGHIFWVLYVPGSTWSWVYDVGEALWHKRAAWVNSVFQAHWGWNHCYAYGQHLIGDWGSGNLYSMSMANVMDNGTTIRRLRRAPTVSDEMERIYHSSLTVDFANGLGPQPPLLDGDGNPRPPQAMLRWSDDRGNNWSNEHIADCGFAGQYHARTIWRRLGQSRYRVYELSVTDPIQWTIVDAYLKTG